MIINKTYITNKCIFIGNLRYDYNIKPYSFKNKISYSLPIIKKQVFKTSAVTLEKGMFKIFVYTVNYN